VHVTKASVENNFSTGSFEHWFDNSDIADRQKIRRLVDELAWEHMQLIEGDKTNPTAKTQRKKEPKENESAPEPKDEDDPEDNDATLSKDNYKNYHSVPGARRPRRT